MGTIWDDVFLGTAEKYNQKLEMLVKMAQPERWTYKWNISLYEYRVINSV